MSNTKPRFVWHTHNYYDGIERSDAVCVDQATGKEVVRYDLGDPANWHSEYGGWSHDEYLERKGFDPNERIPA